MPEVSAEYLRRAFIDPIRFALLVDDEFPVYSKLIDEGSSQAFRQTPVKDLFEFCRRQGWLCDVESRPQSVVDFEEHKHLHQSDLLILDWQLAGENSPDATQALRVLQRLAASDNFNLAIVYTGANIFEVARDMAYSLGAGEI
ncbi:hypothetical protein IQ250_29795, partial [Pseudanabaenaceae cyanobacterium LEGE 13415]|nr:hypothetical protein [Pseudanabaenaceae cyanobacterium LEGE 13415]